MTSILRSVFIPYFLLVSSALGVYLTHFYAPSEIKVKQAFISPPPKMTYFSFGQQMTISDLIWVRVIFDVDYCENRDEKSSCRKGNWLYNSLNEATDLGPNNIAAYREGGLSLSVLISDISGATHIFDKGLAIIKDDWNLYYRAAYHALIEEKDKKKAADRFLAAAKILGPKGEWFYTIAGRLYKEGGEKDIAIEIYHHMKEIGVHEGFIKRLKERLDVKE
jgi:hypothetical protein